MKIALLILSFSTLGFGQMLEGDLLDALNGSDWGSEYRSRNTPSGGAGSSSGQSSPAGPSDSELGGNRTSQDLSCNSEEERTTIPYKFFLGLLANKDLSVSHDPHSGTLTLDGGIMIGNCQSMLETIVSKPTESMPYYTFQVGIKRPGSCSGETCQYEITKIENGANKSETKSFKPNFAGFVSCLESSGVFVDGKINQNKVAPLEFVHTERDITQTSEVVYANRGYKGTRYAGQFSGNKMPNFPGCYYFEDLKEEGFKTYSVDDMETFELEQLYQKVCNSGNYKLVDSHISDFAQITPLQNSLVDIRNQLILDEVKRLHEIVTESEDLSDVDRAKFKEVTSDFLDHVVLPLKTELAQLQRLYANPGHSQKENILNSVFGPNRAQELMGMDPGKLKAEVKKEMDIKASELVSYAREPYLTSEDYIKMSSGKSGAPIDNSTWTGAVLDLYEIHNTAFNYGRYSDDFWEANYKDNPVYKHEKRYATGAVLDKKISAKVREKRTSIQRVADIASNPGVDHAAKYERAKQNVLANIDRQIADRRRTMQEAMVKIQTNCAQEKAMKYWINQQACVRDARAQYEACVAELRELEQERARSKSKYDELIAEWNRAKEQATGRSVETPVSDPVQAPAPSRQGDGHFTFTPTETTQPAVNDQYSMQMQQMQQMREQQMRQQQLEWQQNNAAAGYQMGYQLGGNLLGAGLNFGLSAGLGAQYGMGMQGPYQGYTPYAGMGMYNRYPAGGYYGGMSPAMNYYGNPQTLPGGSLNFNPGGGQMWAGGTPGFYAPGGPGYGGSPSGGAAGGAGFSFGF